MSIEEYLYTRDRNLLIESSPSVRPYADRSAIEFEAQVILAEGAHGLRKIEIREEADLPYTLYTGKQLRDRNDVVSFSFRLNHAAVIMGTSLHEIIRILDTERFSELEFAARYSASVGDISIAPKINPSTYAELPVTGDQIEQMREIAAFDPTLSDFFYVPQIKALPSGMRRILEESRTQWDIMTYIAPVYRRKLHIQGLPPTTSL